MNQKISEALAHEEALGKLVERIRLQLFEDICNEQTLPGVKVIDASFPCSTVPLSTVKEHGTILAPYYYTPKTQARLVNEQLTGAKTVSELMSRCREMVETEKVKTGGNTYLLNPETVKVLKKTFD